MKVHSFESLAAVDGEGLRYAVFLSGCPLRCVYCHNPDTWEGEGTDYTPERLCAKILRYKPYFGKEGGATFSGGEPLLQAKEIAETGDLLRKHGVNYAIDTSGALPLTDDVKRAVSGAQLVVCDLKMFRPEDFSKYMKGDLSLVFAFLDYLKEIGKKTWIRTVILPAINDSEEKIRGYAEIVKSYPNVTKYELLGFHTMGFYKYERLGLSNPLKDTPPMDEERLEELQRYADRIVMNP